MIDRGQQTLPFEESETDVRPRKIGAVSVQYVPVQDILTRATGFMDAYDYTLNPYAGCSFGCSYCYAAFFSGSAERTNSWGAWVDVKENAVQRLERRAASLDGKLIYMSSVTDAYQPIERRLGMTRSLLEVMARGYKPKLVVQTRSPDVVRDCDLFRQIIEHGGRVQVNFTVTTDDEEVRRTFEPHCPNNRVRLRAAREMCESGVDTCITLTPLLLVSDVDAFSDMLLGTGVKNYIGQPFHFQRGKFVAGTRDKAQCLMANKLGTDLAHMRREYLAHYEGVRNVLRRRLPSLGEGKDGFKPPF